MPRFVYVLLAGLGFVLLGGCHPEPPVETGVGTTGGRPNVLLIVADDMGYNDLGAWGSEIATPNLDELAFGGLRFLNFHGAPSCSPARAMLMSGTTNHQAGIGAMNIKIRYDTGREPEPTLPGLGMPGYEGHLSERVAALPEILRAAGYRTYMTGKWDLGRALDDAHMPAQRGFESSFILTPGAAVHLAFPDNNASGGAHRADPYPYQENGTSLTELPEDFFATAAYTDKLIDYIEADRGEGRPFFAWLAYTAPHWPLQVPDDWRDRYAGRYDEGYEVLRDRRFAKASELGIYPENLDLNGYESQAPDWESLTEDERRIKARAMELYAAMLENMDFHIGRLLDYLEETGQLENTAILFMSDNGADGAEGGGIRLYFTPDNSFENLGRYDSWVTYGRGWAEAATAPFRGIKHGLAEGGTRVAAFVNYRDVARPGEFDRSYLTYMDVAPTILQITGVAAPDGTFEGRSVVPMMGKSFWHRALGSSEPVHGPDDAIVSELHGNRALVKGDWKILMEADTGQWELFNLAEDPGERNDLAGVQPDRLAELIEDWERLADETGIVY